MTRIPLNRAYEQSQDMKEKLEMSTAEIGLAVRTTNCLEERGVFTVNGSGSDILDYNDQFHYVYQPMTGNVTVIARVASIQNTNAWAKGGVMIRETLDPGSRHAFALATPRTERGLAFQRRVTTNGETRHTAGPAWNPPAWLKLSRRGDTITASYRQDAGDAWKILARQTYESLPAMVFAGLAVSSHVGGTLATATFESVTIDRN